MNKKIENICNWIIEGCFYALLVTITFSISLTEIAASFLILAFLMKKTFDRDFRTFLSLPFYLLGLYIVWVLLSAFHTSYADESFRGTIKVIKYSLLFVAIATTKWKEKSCKRFLYVLLFSSIIIALSGFFQYLTGQDFIRHRSLILNDYLRRVSSSFVHPNDYGAYLTVVAIMFISVLTDELVRLRSRINFLLAFAVVMTNLFLTQSRGAWISFLTGVIAFLSVRAKRIIIFFVAFLIVVLFVTPEPIKDRVSGLLDVKSGTTWERIMLWKGTIDMIKVHPVLGFGVNTYSRNFPAYKPAEYPDERYSHNCYLQMASEIGIIGALLFMFFIFSILVYFVRKKPLMENDLKYVVSSGLFAAIIAFSVNSFFDTHLYSVNLAVFFFILLGYLYSLSRNA